MASPFQIAANRRNALLSTGPKTPEGKARSSKNAITHGLLARDVIVGSEDPDDLAALRETMFDQFAPVGQLEASLVDRMVGVMWRLRRLSRVESSIFNHNLMDRLHERAERDKETLEREGEEQRRRARYGDHEFPKVVSNTARYEAAHQQAAETELLRDGSLTLLGAAFVQDAADANAFAKLSRYEAAMERSLYRALHELQRLQAARAGDPVVAPVAIDVDVGVTGAVSCGDHG